MIFSSHPYTQAGRYNKFQNNFVNLLTGFDIILIMKSKIRIPSTPLFIYFYYFEIILFNLKDTE